MRRQTRQVRGLAIPVKVWLQRFAFWLLIAAASGLVILGRAETGFVAKLRISLNDVSAPALDLLSRPLIHVSHFFEEVWMLVDIIGENGRLREENARLINWHQTARKMQKENKALRTLLNLVAEPSANFITARVIADGGGAFVRTILLNAGSRNDVKTGQAVVNGDGLVGRVVEIGNHSARVLLLTDFNSRIPVVVESSREPAILAGNNLHRPVLQFLSVNARPVVGNRIVTSGEGEMLPPGIPVGIVAEVGDEAVSVQTFVNWYRLEYVRVLNYALPGVLPTTRFAGTAETLP